MPTYTSSNSIEVFAGEPCVRFAPDTTTITNKYVKGLPAGVTLTDHEPTISPWVLLADVSSVPMATPVDTTLYDNVVVFNATDENISLSANEDDTNAIFIASNSMVTYSNASRMIGCLEVLSMGSGNVYIHGVY